jgi:hypothetical protein
MILAIGTPLTAFGFFGFPILNWLGAMLVAIGGVGVGMTTIAVARKRAIGSTRWLLAVAGGTLFVTMPLAAAYASGTAFGIGLLDVPAMAAIHGGLNVLGFAIPAMVAWSRIEP